MSVRTASRWIARSAAPVCMVLVLGTSASARADCPQPGDAASVATPAGGALRGADGLHLTWRAEPAAGPRVSQPFGLRVALCPTTARLAAVDATMPEHRHGMNYRPSVKPVDGAPGVWQVQGLLWHMPGRWELRFEVDGTGPTRQVLRQSVTLK